MDFSFATVINCMDGRVQLPVLEWMKGSCNVDCIDTITEAGPNGILAEQREPCMSTIKERVLISINGHGSRTVALVAHHDCAGNPGPREMQIEHLRKGLELLESWDLPAKVMGIYVNENWQVEPVQGCE